jgi:dipeptide transport system permease protein
VSTLGGLSLTLFAVSVFVFVLLRVLPGDPVTMMLGDRVNDQALADRMRAELGFDRPIPVQYWQFLQGAARGDLGRSHRTGRSVTGDLVDSIPATLELAVVAGFLSALFGLGVGALGPVTGRRDLDLVATALTTIALAIPTFWLGLLLAWTFAFRIPVFELGGRSSGDFFAYQPRSGVLLIDALLTGNWSLAQNALRHLALPAFTLALANAAVLARVTRASLRQALAAPHIHAARARGIHSGRLLRHATANAILPITAALGLQAASLLSGAMVTEEIFDWPGLGTYLIQSIRFRDYPCIQAALLAVVTLTILANSTAAAIAGTLDPRIRQRA